MPESQPQQKLRSHYDGTLHEIRWTEICPWLILVKALRVTLLIRVLVFATIGVMLTHSGWRVISQFLPPEVPLPSRLRVEMPIRSLPPESETAVLAEGSNFSQRSALVRGWYWLAEPFLQAANRELSWQASLGSSLYGLWAIVIWALFGGAIARIAALYLTRGETLGPIEALRDAITVWPRTAGAPLIVLSFALALAVPLVLLGWLLRLNSLAVIAGLLWCFVLAWSFGLAVLLVLFFFGWPLMWACLGVERSDAFDGVSRCFAYVYQRPLQLAFFVLVAALLGFLGEAVVAYFSAATVTISEWILSWGAGNARLADLLGADGQNSGAFLATRAINGWKWGLESLTAAYPLACLWPMAVGIYLLLRRQIDATEMDEVTLSDAVQSPPPHDPTAHE